MLSTRLQVVGINQPALGTDFHVAPLEAKVVRILPKAPAQGKFAVREKVAGTCEKIDFTDFSTTHFQ
jgi:hypothetical protein